MTQINLTLFLTITFFCINLTFTSEKPGQLNNNSYAISYKEYCKLIEHNILKNALNKERQADHLAEDLLKAKILTARTKNTSPDNIKNTSPDNTKETFYLLRSKKRKNSSSPIKIPQQKNYGVNDTNDTIESVYDDRITSKPPKNDKENSFLLSLKS